MPGDTLTVGELIEKLSRLDRAAKVYNAHLLKGGTELAVLPVVWTAEKDGKVLLLDPDVFRALVVAKAGAN